MKHTRTPTTLEYALLGLLSLGDKSAYDIRQLFVQTPMTHFSSSPGSVYPALERLQRRGLLRSRLQPGRRGADRRIYAITPGGLDVLVAWLREPPSRELVETDIRVAFLRFSFMPGQLTTDEIIGFLDTLEEYVAEYRDVLQGWVSRFREMRAVHAELGALHGVMAFATHLDWIAAAKRRIRRRGDGEGAT